MRNDLSQLGISATDRRRLEAMGLNAVEQIVLMDRYSLGLGVKKSDSLIQSAANMLANRHFKDILIEENRVTVHTEGGEAAFLLAAAKVIFTPFADYVFSDNRIIITPGRGPYTGDFGYVLRNARRWVDVASAERKDELENITLRREELIKFARQRSFDGFISNVFGDIKGNTLMKMALAAAMFSSMHEPLHVLIVGEPASGKTMARDIITESFTDVVPIGANSTRAGLVCNRGTGELGALAYANEKLALIDEFDKLDEDDVQYCYELFSNAKCQVDSARVHTTIESHFTAIAFANPKWEIFKGRPMEEIGVRATMLSRFAFIVPSEILQVEDFKEILAVKLTQKSEIKSLPQYYDQWIKLSRLHKPQMKASESSQKAFINEGASLYQRYVASHLRRDIRLADYLPRLVRTLARVDLSDVTDDILERGLCLARDTMKAWD